MRHRNLFALILIFSVLVRVIVAFYLGDVVDAPPLMTDQRSYHALGARILQGHGYSFDSSWYPFTRPETPTAHWSFLYPLFVSAVYALFGIHPLAVRLLQGVLGGLLLPWLVYRLARRLFPQRPWLPLIASAATATYAYFILHAATLMTETFYIAFVLWGMELSLRIEARLRAREAIPLGEALQLGLSFGLATLMRQSILPWLPLLLLWLLWRAWRAGQLRQAAYRLALGGVLIVGLIAPWTYRNYRVYGQFLLLNSNTGYAMYSAQHPMHGTTFHEYAAAPLPEDLRRDKMNEAQMDRELMRCGLAFVAAEPGRYLRLCLSRVRAYFEFWPTADTTLLHNIGRTGSFGLYLPFMIYGLLLALREPAVALRTKLIIAFAVFYGLIHILTWSMVRYRLVVDATLMPFVARAVQEVYLRLARRLGWERPLGRALQRIASRESLPG